MLSQTKSNCKKLLLLNLHIAMSLYDFVNIILNFVQRSENAQEWKVIEMYGRDGQLHLAQKHQYASNY